MKVKLFVIAFAVLILTLSALTGVSAAETPADLTLSTAVPAYTPKLADLLYVGTNAGDVAEADVAAVGTALQYSGLILDGDGANPNAAHPFLKVQSQSAS